MMSTRAQVAKLDIGPGGHFSFEWDDTDSVDSMFNNWTEEDFIKFFVYRAPNVVSLDDYRKYKKWQ